VSAIFVNVRSQTAGLTGVQRYIRELCSRLGGRVRAICPGRPLHGIRGHLWEQTVLPRIARGHLLWSPANTGPLTIGRQVLTVHDTAAIDHPEWFDTRFSTWYRSITPILARRVSRLITVSEFSKRRLLELTGIPGSRVAVIPNGVDARFHPRSVDEIRRMRKKTGIIPETYFLTVSSLEPRKNLSRLLEAWRLSADRLPADVWLVIAGAEGKENVFRTANIQSIPPRVLFAGFVADEDLPALYSGAIALVYPSIYEGFGLPALEAMAAGTVPIVADSTSLPEVVGEAGLLVDPLRVEELSEAIIRIVEDGDLRAKLSRRGIQRGFEFTWERAADATWRVLMEADAE
jgi:glycosyltransferase involved in cell wall biosynthesis